ncbi:type II TA system antitoxin MqsA family protein [Rhizobium leguminosarum]|uniref:type II TA system antitoxin MqsA family protein n=1 Tax=Rhizobium leguminosarum TaxID=384 RepID=UPI003F97450C
MKPATLREAKHMDSSHICDFCGGRTEVRQEELVFTYGAGDEAVDLRVMVPVFHCLDCDEAYMGEEAEILRHEAVCKYLGRLTPAEIKAIREKYGRTQEQFAEVSGFGVASIKRWESGNQIQNVSADRLLQFLADERNYRRAQIMPGSNRPRPTFRTEISDRTSQEAAEFSLRPVANQKLAA